MRVAGPALENASSSNCPANSVPVPPLPGAPPGGAPPVPPARRSSSPPPARATFRASSRPPGAGARRGRRPAPRRPGPPPPAAPRGPRAAIEAASSGASAKPRRLRPEEARLHEALTEVEDRLLREERARAASTSASTPKRRARKAPTAAPPASPAPSSSRAAHPLRRRARARSASASSGSRSASHDSNAASEAREALVAGGGRAHAKPSIPHELAAVARQLASNSRRCSIGPRTTLRNSTSMRSTISYHGMPAPPGPSSTSGRGPHRATPRKRGGVAARCNREIRQSFPRASGVTADFLPQPASVAAVSKGLTYRDAGVDIDAGERLVDRIKPLAARTRIPEVLGAVGGFAGLCRRPGGLEGAGAGERHRRRGDQAPRRVPRRRARHGRHRSGGDVRQRHADRRRAPALLPRLLRDRQARRRAWPKRWSRASPRAASWPAARSSAGRRPRCRASYPEGEYDLAGFAVGVVERAADPGRQPRRGGRRADRRPLERAALQRLLPRPQGPPRAWRRAPSTHARGLERAARRGAARRRRASTPQGGRRAALDGGRRPRALPRHRRRAARATCRACCPTASAPASTPAPARAPADLRVDRAQGGVVEPTRCGAPSTSASGSSSWSTARAADARTAALEAAGETPVRRSARVERPRRGGERGSLRRMTPRPAPTTSSSSAPSSRRSLAGALLAKRGFRVLLVAQDELPPTYEPRARA